MEQTVFSPGVSVYVDKVATSLIRIAHTILAISIGFLPILFLPQSTTALGYTKAFIVLCCLAAALVLYIFAFLRSGSVTLKVPGVLIAMWGIVFSFLVSALLSGDLFDSVIGNTLNAQTLLGFSIITSVTTMMIAFGMHKAQVMRLFLILFGTTVVLGIFHLLRVLFGVDFLSLGIFTAATSSPFGSWNDVALLFALVIILTLTALDQLPLSKIGRIALLIVGSVSMFLLVLINFSPIWFVLGFISLAILIFSLTKQRFIAGQASDDSNTLVSLLCSAAVFLVSVVSIIGGGALSAYISSLTSISYVEVRPSAAATLDIGRAVFSENIFSGVGPNRFADAWRIYKDDSINETIFWNTEFSAGFGFVPTSMVESGLLGVVAWLVFLGLFVYTGVRTFFTKLPDDKLSSFILIASYVSALFVWGMSIVYVPGISLLLLGAAMTGIFLGARSTIHETRSFKISIAQSRSAAFMMVGLVMIVITAVISIIYFTSRHYFALTSFNNAVVELSANGDFPLAETSIAQAYTLSNNDAFAREIALYKLSQITALFTIAEPTVADRQAAQTALADGLAAIELAIAEDESDPLNWRVYGLIFSLLTGAGDETARERGIEAFAKARALDPFNPEIALLEAQLAVRANDMARAREKIAEAISLKSNYTDALIFATELDIAEGKVEDAIATTQAIINLEPRNPARYYQLGVLLSSTNKIPESIVAFEQAIALDQNFSNARYFLALALFQQGNKVRALVELKKVQELNPDNAELAAAITGIENGQINPPSQATAPVENIEPVASEDGQVTVSEDPNTDLVTPVNPLPEESSEESESAQE